MWTSRSRSRSLAAAVLLAGAGCAAAAPEADLWARWAAHDPGAAATIDHSEWTGLLARHVSRAADGVNRFDYAGIGDADRAALDAYVERLAATAIDRFARAEQRAYWINLYNALTVRLVIEHFPVKSIRDISPGLFSFGPWDEKLVEVQGEALSLNDIEHRILRPIWTDPRLHYALNCASIGCPNLQPEAFTAANAESLLDRGAREYVNHPRGVALVSGELIVSSIYDWYEDDFGGDARGVIEHLLRYAEPALAERLRGRASLDGHDYDWSLNRK